MKGYRLTTEEIFERIHEKHNDKYDLSNVPKDNIKSSTVIYPICPIHGEFRITVGNFMLGKGCPKCVGRNLTNEERIANAKKIHGDKYSYEKTNFATSKGETIVICPIHGEFTTSYDRHVNNKNGCPFCSSTMKCTEEEYIRRAKEIHGVKYIYENIRYRNMHDYVYPICPIHGVFKVEAQSHLRGCGCQKCNPYTLENAVRDVLNEGKILFEEQVNKKKFEWLNNYSLDFFIPSLNLAIECQGKQHFGQGGWSENFDFEDQYRRDKEKFNLCNEHDLNVIYYTNVKNINDYYNVIFTSTDEVMNYIKNYRK